MKIWISGLLVMLTALCATANAQGTASTPTISGTPVSSVPSVSGSVNEILEYNNLILIGGAFTSVGGQTRNGLAAFDATTGSLHAWNPSVSGGEVSDMAIAGNTLYIAGPFSSIDGQPRGQLASFDLNQMGQSNHGLTSWDPVLSNTTNVFFFGNDVECLEVMGNTLYVGGFFGQVNGTTRGGLASFDLTNLSSNDGLTSWDPNTYTNNGQTGTGFEIWGVFNMVAHPASNTIVISGPFEGVGGTHMDDGTSSPHTATARASFAAVDATGTGAVKSWAPSVSNAAWNDDAMIIDGDVVYHGAPRSGSPVGLDITQPSNPYTSFAPLTDDQAYTIGVNPAGTLVIMSGIWTTVSGAAANELLAFDASTGNVVSGWDPNPDTYVVSTLVTNDRVYVGGAFTNIAGQSIQGLAAFDIISPVQITTTTLPGGTAGQAYSAQFAASGGQSPYSWSATGLPGGWSMSSSGLISASNSAVTPGNYNFSVTVTDNLSQQDSGNFSVTITAPTLSITTGATLPDGTEGVSYNASLNATGGWGSYAWSVASGSSLPSGWLLGASSGQLSASASACVAGNYSFTIQVSDGSQTDSRQFNVTVNPAGAPLSISSSATLPNGMQGTAYSFQFVATGGQGSYFWTMPSHNLPTGWNLDSSTGVLSAGSGSVLGGNFSLTVQVSDGTSTDSLTAGLTIDVPSLQITTLTLPGGEEGSPYAATLNASGGSGVGYQWSISAGQLPPGIGMNASGTSLGLSGTPGAVGTFMFTVMVEDSLSNTAVQNYTVVIDAPGSGGSGDDGESSGGSSGGGGCIVGSGSTSALVMLLLFGVAAAALRRKRTA